MFGPGHPSSYRQKFDLKTFELYRGSAVTSNHSSVHTTHIIIIIPIGTRKNEIAIIRKTTVSI